MARPKFVRMAVIAGGLALAATAAQAQVTLTPFIGSFYGISKYFDADIDLSNFGGSGTARFTSEQTNTAAFGLRVGVGIGATLAVEGEFAYLNSDVRFTGKDAFANGVDLSTNFSGDVLAGSLRLVFKPRRSNLSFFAGPSVVNHSGDAWDFPANDKLTNVGGVVGASLRAQVSPRFALEITAEGYIYTFDPDESDDTDNGFFANKTQADVIVSIGVPFTLSR